MFVISYMEVFHWRMKINPCNIPEILSAPIQNLYLQLPDTSMATLQGLPLIIQFNICNLLHGGFQLED